MEIRPENPNEQPLVKQGPTIPELYSRADAADPNSSFDHSQFTPQVLITWSCMQWTPWYWLERREGTSHRLAPSTCGSVSPLVTVQSAPPSHHVHLLLFWEAWHWRLNVTGARALLYRSIPWESAAILAHIELWQVAPCTLCSALWPGNATAPSKPTSTKHAMGSLQSTTDVCFCTAVGMMSWAVVLSLGSLLIRLVRYRSF